MPRGFVFGEFSVVKSKLEFAAEFISMAKSGQLDVDGLAEDIFDEAALSFFSRHGIAA